MHACVRAQGVHSVSMCPFRILCAAPYTLFAPLCHAQQYIDAVEYLHSHRVAHRDLKLDNIVLDGHRPPRIKVCDFGFAKNWDDESNMFTQVSWPHRDVLWAASRGRANA